MVDMTLALLRAELDNDPKTLGYAALWAQSNGPEAVAAKLNQAGASVETLFKTRVPTDEAKACIVLAEYTALSAASKQACDFFLSGTAFILSGSTNMRATIAGLFAAGATRTALIAIASRSAARAEILWGEGFRVTDVNVADAKALP